MLLYINLRLLHILKKSVKILSGRRIIFYTSLACKGTQNTLKHNSNDIINPIDNGYENKEIA